jgi:hypothetical protein
MNCPLELEMLSSCLGVSITPTTGLFKSIKSLDFTCEVAIFAELVRASFIFRVPTLLAHFMIELFVVKNRFRRVRGGVIPGRELRMPCSVGSKLLPENALIPVKVR